MEQGQISGSTEHCSRSLYDKKNESDVLKRTRKDLLIVYVRKKCLNSKHNETYTEVGELKDNYQDFAFLVSIRII